MILHVKVQTFDRRAEGMGVEVRLSRLGQLGYVAHIISWERVQALQAEDDDLEAEIAREAGVCLESLLRGPDCDEETKP